jgi:hypothetical protein
MRQKPTRHNRNLESQSARDIPLFCVEPLAAQFKGMLALSTWKYHSIRSHPEDAVRTCQGREESWVCSWSGHLHKSLRFTIEKTKNMDLYERYGGRNTWSPGKIEISDAIRGAATISSPISCRNEQIFDLLPIDCDGRVKPFTNVTAGLGSRCVIKLGIIESVP